MTRAGFTLPEMLMALGIGSLLLTGLLAASTGLQRWFAAADYLVNTQQDQTTTLDYLAADIRRATVCATANSGLKLVLTLPDQTVRDRDGGLTAPTIADGLLLHYGPKPPSVSWYIQSGNTLVRDDGTKALVLSGNADSFRADASAPPAVTVTLTFRPGPRQTLTRSVSTTIQCRNLATRLQ